MSHEPAQPLPFAIAADADDVEVAALIESWRYRGPAVSWDAVVGHAPQVRRCQEIVEALRRPEADLERLRIRLGRGILLAGPAGTGKTDEALAIATDLGIDFEALGCDLEQFRMGLGVELEHGPRDPGPGDQRPWR
jgi:SpoVK/Ycf46/Vps4 family AAA+-type ATPase